MQMIPEALILAAREVCPDVDDADRKDKNMISGAEGFTRAREEDVGYDRPGYEDTGAWSAPAWSAPAGNAGAGANRFVSVLEQVAGSCYFEHAHAQKNQPR